MRRFWVGCGLVVALLLFGRNALYGGLITLTNSTPGYFDNSSGNRTVTVTGLEPGYGTGAILDVNISITFCKAHDADGSCVSTFTAFPNEIRFRLTSPGAVAVTLIDAASFNYDAFPRPFDSTITFDQAAAQVVNIYPALVPSGTFRPTGPGSLNDFNGASALGTWTLFIEDTDSGDGLLFRSLELNVTTRGDAVIPEPAGWLLTGAGMLGFVLYRRRR